MDTLAIFGTQFVLSLVVFSLVARWYVAPWLAGMAADRALALLLLPHTLRHVGLTFLVPVVAGPGMPAGFAAGAGYGDLASGLLALVALIALHGRWRAAVPLVWLFNVVGTADLMTALPQAAAVPHFAATWFIPTFVVPLLLMSHAMIFARLLRLRRDRRQAAH